MGGLIIASVHSMGLKFLMVLKFLISVCPVHSKKKEEKEERSGKTILKRGQKWTLSAQLGRLKTGQDGKKLLRSHLRCPQDLPRLWNRIEWT